MNKLEELKNEVAQKQIELSAAQKELRDLQSYEEQWKNMPEKTPVLVRNSEGDLWESAEFAGWNPEEGKPMVRANSVFSILVDLMEKEPVTEASLHLEKGTVLFNEIDVDYMAPPVMNWIPLHKFLGMDTNPEEIILLHSPTQGTENCKRDVFIRLSVKDLETVEVPEDSWVSRISLGVKK